MLNIFIMKKYTNIKFATRNNINNGLCNHNILYKKKIILNCQKKYIEYNNASYMRTNCIAESIEKLYNDINMIKIYDTDEVSDQYECKNIALFNAILIIILLIFMFVDNDNNSDKDPVLIDNQYDNLDIFSFIGNNIKKILLK